MTDTKIYGHNLRCFIDETGELRVFRDGKEVLSTGDGYLDLSDAELMVVQELLRMQTDKSQSSRK